MALAVTGLCFGYGGRRVLDELSFSIAGGETVVLLGPNGAGKTTLFSLICGLFSAPRDCISIAGRSLAADGAKALAPLGMVFQAQTLDLDLTVRQNLLYFCRLRGLGRRHAARRIDEELHRMSMRERVDERVRDLNGGHRRRVEIARAFLHDPAILLLDEPTVGLDIPTRRDLILDLHARGRDAGTALLWATHLIDEVAETDRVLVLSQGRIVEDGTPAEILERTGTTTLDQAFAALTRETRP